MTLLSELEALFTAAGVPNAHCIMAIHCGPETGFALEIETVDPDQRIAPGQGDLTRTVTSITALAALTWGDDERTPIYDSLLTA